MKEDTVVPGSWRTHFFITGSVLFTVIMALVLAQLDNLQRQILPSPVAAAIINLIATPTNTPLPAIPLASSTPTVPSTSTPTGQPENAAVPVLPVCDAVPPGWVLTPIEAGETLLTLSLRLNVSEEKLRLANCLEPDSLVSADALYLPTEAAANPVIDCARPAGWVNYVVRRGDTLFSLARSRGILLLAVINANCIDVNETIYAGQTLYLPPLSIVPLPSTATHTPTATATLTPTGTSTATTTPTGTSTPPPLPTMTATPTATPTGTVTASVTATATTSPTASPPPSATPSPSASPTATATPSASATATGTPTSTATATATGTPTATASATQTNTPAPSNTPTATASSTPTETVTGPATP